MSDKRYEYDFVPICLDNDRIERTTRSANILGDSSWEIVQLVPSDKFAGATHIAVLKRELT